LLGLISDTHGYFDPRLLDVFRGVERILHAGDIGSLDVIERLEAIAPLTAVHGNMDRPDVAGRFPADTTLQIAGTPTGRASRRKAVSCTSTRARRAGR
jgi:predicted phosphodiesterase